MIKLSKVEEKFLKDSGRRLQYEGEFIPVIEVEDKDSLGKLVVLRFLEWVLNHPDGVIALPTGKSPESFIKALKYFKEEWQTPQVQEEFEEHGIVSKEFPDTSNLKFVQIDEYFPINPNDKNSFLHFDKTNYLSILDIKPQNLLTIDATSFSHLSYDDLENLFPEGRVDLSLLQRDTKDEKERLQKDVLLKVDESCKKYEEKIQQWGGIGFCLGGIGLDGHIAFNMSGFSFDSRTRLVKLNYASAAAAAKGFGGIEYSKDKAAITIGLKTITQKKDAIIIIIALGLGKVEIVAKAIEEKKTENIPASVLQGVDGARFYVTKKIASKLYARRSEDLSKIKNLEEKPQKIDEIIYDVSLRCGKPIIELTKDDFARVKKGKILLDKKWDVLEEAKKSYSRLVEKIEQSLSFSQDKKILHTSPHPDDVMLSYYSYVKDLLSSNENYFAYLTNGFNAVSDKYLKDQLEPIEHSFLQERKEEIFDLGYDKVLQKFATAYKENDSKSMEIIEKVIFLRGVVLSFKVSNLDDLLQRLKMLKEGEIATFNLKDLKGFLREAEVDCLWTINDVPIQNIIHMKSKFYSSNASVDKEDIKPMVKLINKIKPNEVFVAFDPKGIGPNTHYKALQIVAEALKEVKDKNLVVYGYRNVWYRFNSFDANVMVPVSKEKLKDFDKAFVSCFPTQKQADFPSYKYNGPFSELSSQIQKEQLSELKALLGKEFFEKHKDEKVRNADSMIFLKKMNVDEFLIVDVL